MKKIIIGISCLIFICGSIFLGIFYVQTSAVSRSKDIVNFEIKKGDTYLTIADTLKKDNLIKSTLFYKIYIKIFNPTKVQVGKYDLSESMSVSQIINVFSKGSNFNPDTVKFTIPEGKTMMETASIISSVTDYTKEDIINLWNSESFVDEVISKYWFVKEDVKKDGIGYPLEGYLFPDTYELTSKSVDIKTIAYKMLDRTNQILTNYKDVIEKSEYTIHQILTLASMVEEEGITPSDRALIAGVFYNRLSINMSLGSDVTSYYGYEVKLGRELTKKEKIDALYDENPYNTRGDIKGLPIGPICNPSESSIIAAIKPTDNEYIYFIANTCDASDHKTYFAKTYDEHLNLKNLYLTCE